MRQYQKAEEEAQSDCVVLLDCGLQISDPLLDVSSSYQGGIMVRLLGEPEIGGVGEKKNRILDDWGGGAVYYCRLYS